MDENKMRFERKIVQIGNSQGIILNNDIMNWLGNPEELYLMPDHSKHGKFLAIWSKTPPQKEVTK